MSPRELRLRERIDVIADERDRLARRVTRLAALAHKHRCGRDHWRKACIVAREARYALARAMREERDRNDRLVETNRALHAELAAARVDRDRYRRLYEQERGFNVHANQHGPCQVYATEEERVAARRRTWRENSRRQHLKKKQRSALALAGNAPTA